MSKRYLGQLSIWAVLAAFVHALYACALIVDANGSVDAAFHGDSWRLAISQISIVTAFVFIAVMSLGVLWGSQLMPRSIFVGACIGCTSIAIVAASWASYAAIESNPQDIYWDTQAGRLHLVAFFNIFYPWLLFSFLASAFLVFLLLTVNYWLEAKPKPLKSQ